MHSMLKADRGLQLRSARNSLSGQVTEWTARNRKPQTKQGLAQKSDETRQSEHSAMRRRPVQIQRHWERRNRARLRETQGGMRAALIRRAGRTE